MKKSIIKYSPKRRFDIHPDASEAFNFYANLENQFLVTCQPESILAGLNKYQTVSFTVLDSCSYIFSGFANRFFDPNNIDKTSLLIEYKDISDADIETMAWLDVLTQVFSSKREVSGRADLFKAINQYLPTTPALQSLFPGAEKVTLESFSAVANVQKLTLQKNLSRRNK